jgi:hypothetical protein
MITAILGRNEVPDEALDTGASGKGREPLDGGR